MGENVIMITVVFYPPLSSSEEAAHVFKIQISIRLISPAY